MCWLHSINTAHRAASWSKAISPGTPSEQRCSPPCTTAAMMGRVQIAVRGARHESMHCKLQPVLIAKERRKMPSSVGMRAMILGDHIIPQCLYRGEQGTPNVGHVFEVPVNSPFLCMCLRQCPRDGRTRALERDCLVPRQPPQRLKAEVLYAKEASEAQRTTCPVRQGRWGGHTTASLPHRNGRALRHAAQRGRQTPTWTHPILIVSASSCCGPCRQGHWWPS